MKKETKKKRTKNKIVSLDFFSNRIFKRIYKGFSKGKKIILKKFGSKL